MSAPLAALLQLGGNDADAPLVALARQGNPGRRWWWGVRLFTFHPDGTTTLLRDGHLPSGSAGPARRGAWCYLCCKPIATWSGRWPVTETAKLAIATHRTHHIQGALPTPPPGDET